MPAYDDELLAEILLFGDLVALAGASSGFLPHALLDTTLGHTQPAGADPNVSTSSPSRSSFQGGLGR